MLKQILKAHFDLQIIDFQCIKTIDTLVFKVLTDDQKQFVVKLYRENSKDLISKLKETAAFLTYLKEQTELRVQAPPLPYFPLVDWENDRRYIVVSEWIEGNVPPLLTADLMEKLGALTAQLHNSAANFSKKLPILRIDNGLIQLVKSKIIARKNWLRINHKKLDQAFRDIENTYKSHSETPSVFGLIHSDLHLKNLIQNGNTLSPIDFDDLAYGHYWLDIALIFNEIEIFSPKEVASKADVLKQQFLIGYKKHRNLPTDFDRQIIDFQGIASALYLNWILKDGNEDLLLNKELLGFAKKNLAKLLK